MARTTNFRGVWVGAALLAAACAGTGERAEDAEAEAAVLAMDVERGAKLVRTPGATPAAETPRRHGNVIHSLNMALISDAPGDVMAKARRLVEESGGRIEHVSHNAQNGNLNAVVAVEQLPTLRARLRGLGERVENENADSRDHTAEIADTRQRLDRTELARTEVLELLRQTHDPDAAEGLSMLLELTNNERRNLRSQLQNYYKQTEGVQLYLSVMASTEGAMLREG